MKSFTFSLSVALLLFAVSLLHATRAEYCPQENCLTPEKCEYEVKSGDCKEKGTTCCSIVKSEYRTHCHHFGGACMERCNPALQQRVVDCPEGQKCCVLV